MKWFFACCVAILCVVVCSPAWAWGPATHLYYGMTVLGQLSQLAADLRSLLSTQAVSFLYGCISADIVLAKRLGNAMTHCHKWENGLRLIEEAPKPRIRSFAFGYVSHLAADTISHNCYVPSKTIQSYESGVLKHMYWELMFDKKVTTPKTVHLFKEIARGDFTDCDEYLEGQIPTRLFDFATNKRIFNQLLLIQGLEHWQKLWTGFSRKNPWPLEAREVQTFSDKSMQAVMSFLKDYKESIYLSVDPTGQQRLRGANQLRRHFKKSLSKDHPPPSQIVRNAVDRFAKEPFQSIEIEELKAA